MGLFFFSSCIIYANCICVLYVQGRRRNCPRKSSCRYIGRRVELGYAPQHTEATALIGGQHSVRGVGSASSHIRVASRRGGFGRTSRVSPGYIQTGQCFIRIIYFHLIVCICCCCCLSFQVIRRVDDMDNPSLFVSPGSSSVLTCLIPICLQNGSILGPVDSTTDASKNGSQSSSGSAAASTEFKRRIRRRPRKFPVIAEPSGAGLVNPSPRSVAAFDSSHPAEESSSASTSGLFGSTASVARATSNKIINFILSSCSE